MCANQCCISLLVIIKLVMLIVLDCTYGLILSRLRLVGLAILLHPKLTMVIQAYPHSGLREIRPDSYLLPC